MAKILSLRAMPDKKVKISVASDIKEALVLQGKIRGIHFFCENLFKTQASILQKKNDLYFSIPFRSVPNRFKKVTCQALEHSTKCFFIYTCHK